MNPIFSGFQKMDIEHYSTQPTFYVINRDVEILERGMHDVNGH